jgi:hypothetical protein
LEPLICRFWWGLKISECSGDVSRLDVAHFSASIKNILLFSD